jgi:hypothetical protein
LEGDEIRVLGKVMPRAGISACLARFAGRGEAIAQSLHSATVWVLIKQMPAVSMTLGGVVVIGVTVRVLVAPD